jgi:hypothetical protein
MKTISFRLTDKQAHYLELIAEKNMRTVEHLIWQTLPWGIISLAQDEISTSVEKLPQDWTDEDRKALQKVDHYSENFAPSFTYQSKDDYVDHGRNILADLKNTLEVKDKECDVAAELKLLKEAKAAYKKAHKAKQEAKRKAELKESARQIAEMKAELNKEAAAK